MGTDKKLWQHLRREVQKAADQEPFLASYYHATVLSHTRLEMALSYHLASKLSNAFTSATLLHKIMSDIFCDMPSICCNIESDLHAIRERDPAARGYATPFLYFKGFQALQTYRVGHCLWKQNRYDLAYFLQSRISELFGIDIHPAAQIGKGILFDHGTGVVIGETAVIEDNVSMLHSVTLGGTGKETKDRHPKIRRGVLIGAGAKILGNIDIGRNSKVAAGSVVLTDVPPCCTVAGVPAKIVGHTTEPEPSLEMDHRLDDLVKN